MADVNKIQRIIENIFATVGTVVPLPQIPMIGALVSGGFETWKLIKASYGGDIPEDVTLEQIVQKMNELRPPVHLGEEPPKATPLPGPVCEPVHEAPLPVADELAEDPEEKEEE